MHLIELNIENKYTKIIIKILSYMIKIKVFHGWMTFFQRIKNTSLKTFVKVSYNKKYYVINHNKFSINGFYCSTIFGS